MLGACCLGRTGAGRWRAARSLYYSARTRACSANAVRRGVHFVAHLSCSCPSPHRCDACVTALHIHTSAALLFHAQGSDAARARCRLTLFCCAYATRERTCNAARTRGTRGPQIGSFPVFVPLSRARSRSRRDATRADTSSSKRICANETRRVFGLALPRDAAGRHPLGAYQRTNERASLSDEPANALHLAERRACV